MKDDNYQLLNDCKWMVTIFVLGLHVCYVVRFGLGLRLGLGYDNWLIYIILVCCIMVLSV